MKKSSHILTGFLILFLIASTANAQFKMKVGPVTGLNFNIGTGSDLKQTATGFGFVFGGQVDMNFTPTIGMITNLQFYDNRSVSYSEDGTVQGAGTYTLTTSTSLAYFMLEPLFKLSLANSGFYFVGGPMLGFNIEGSVEQSVTSQNNITFNDGTTKIKQSLKNLSVRFGIKLGAGLDIKVSSLVDLTPQFNFEYGITNVQSDVSAKILTFQVLLGAKFRVI